MKSKLLITLIISLSFIFSIAGAWAVECGVTPTDGCTVSTSTTFNTGTYYLNDSAVNGAIRINANNIVLDCNGATIIGNWTSGVSTQTIGIKDASHTNVTIKNCNVNNFYMAYKIQTANNVNLTYNTANNNTWSIYSISNINLSALNNNLISIGSTIYLDGGNTNPYFYNNILTGGRVLTEDYVAGMNFISNNLYNITSNDGLLLVNVTNSNFTNNYLYNITKWSGFNIKLGSANLLFNNNTIDRTSIGYWINQNVYGITINGGIVNNTITNYDGYNSAILSERNVSNLVINGTTLDNVGTCGIVIRRTDYYNITNNNIDLIPLQEGVLRSARSGFEPRAGICVVEMYRSWLGDSIENPTDNISKVSTYNSSNGVISGNTFGSNVDLLLHTQGAINLTSDISNNWFIKSQLVYLQDADSFYISNNFNNLSNVNNSDVINNLFSYGYMNVRKVDYSIFRNYQYYKNVNNSVSYQLNLYNLTNVLISYDNGTNIPVYGTNQEINLTLAPSQYVYVYTNTTTICNSTGTCVITINDSSTNWTNNANLTFNTSSAPSNDFFTWIVDGITRLLGIGQYVFNYVFNQSFHSQPYNVTLITNGTTSQFNIYSNSGSIVLNSPSNGQTIYTNNGVVDFTISTDNNASLANATLYDNSTGSWGARNITKGNGLPYYDSYSDGAINSTLWNAVTGGTGGGSVSETANQYIEASASRGGASGVEDSLGRINSTYNLASYIFTNMTFRAFVGCTSNSGGWVGSANLNVFNNIIQSQTCAGGNSNDDSIWTIETIGNGSYRVYNDGVYTSTIDKINNEIGMLAYVVGSGTGGISASADVKLYKINITTNATNDIIITSNSYPAGSSIKWNAYACDQLGSCGFAPNNYTFYIDGQSPSITLNYPTSIINYGAINGTLQLNFTVNDTNLDKVWYNYNGTNVTITGALSGIANLSNITLSSKKNVTIYANDTAGNINATTFSWDYILFSNQTIYNSNATTTASESFTLVSQKDSSISSISAYLWYSGTPYLSTVTTSGNNVNITNTLEIPAGIASRNFFWQIIAVGTGGTYYINTTSLTQTVSNLSILYCTSPSTTGLTLNFTTYDTATSLPINTTFQATFSYYAQGGSGSVLETYNFQNLTGNRSNYLFCLNSSGRNVTLDAHVEYAATGYDPRSYIIDNGIIGNFTQVIPLYLSSTSLTDIVTVTVQDQNYNPVAGSLVTIQQWNIGTNTYPTIGMFTTSSDGKGIMDLQLYNTWYRAIVTYNGQIIKVTDVQKLSSTSWPITVSIGVSNPYDNFGSISHGLVFDNSTNITTFSWADSSGYVNRGCLIVKNSTSLGYDEIYNTCLSSVAGTINYQLGGNGTYQIYGIVYLTADYDNVSQITDYLQIQLGQPQINKVVSPFGKVLTFIFVGTAGLIGVSAGSPILGILLLIGALFGSSKMGWINGIEAILWGLISVAIILFAMQRRRSG